MYSPVIKKPTAYFQAPGGEVVSLGTLRRLEIQGETGTQVWTRDGDSDKLVKVPIVAAPERLQ